MDNGTERATVRTHTDRPASDAPTDEANAPRRVTVPEAAVLLGISEDAVRSRLRRGTLRKDKRADGAVLVILGGTTRSNRPTTDRDRPPTNHDQPKTDEPTDQYETAPLVEVLQDQVGYLRDQLNQEREANRENRRIIAALTSRIPQLEAPRDEPQAPETDGAGTSFTNTPESETEPQRRSWLYRFFFGP